VPEPPLDLRRLLAALEAHRVRFVVVGGIALAVHGSDHVTLDVDLAYSRAPENLSAVAAALAEFHPRLRGAPEDLPFRWDARTLRAGLNFTLTTEAGRVDLLGEVSGVDSFEGLWERALETELFGVRVRIASIGDLIAMKRAAGRAKDQAHLLELERLRRLTGG
jgi:predicted nucleotidyltransferase